MSDLESVWEHREEVVYRDLFGDIGQGIYALTADVFQQGFNFNEIDPRWLFYGVFESAPNEKHSSWLYVTSGMSNPWDVEPVDYATSERSGLGMEFVLETPEQSRWAIVLLHRMIGYNLLLSIGHFGDRPVLGYGSRIGNRGSIVPGQESELTTVALVKPDHFPATFQLDSGAVDLAEFIGITSAEFEYAKANSTEALVDRLKSGSVYPLTNPQRTSIL
jgi:hypothetical protein